MQVVCGVPDSIELSPLIHGPTGLPPCPATARAGRIATQAYRYSSGLHFFAVQPVSFPTLTACVLVILLNRHTSISVADPDPGSGAFLTPGSGIRCLFDSGIRCLFDPWIRDG